MIPHPFDTYTVARLTPLDRIKIERPCVQCELFHALQAGAATRMLNDGYPPAKFEAGLKGASIWTETDVDADELGPKHFGRLLIVPTRPLLINDLANFKRRDAVFLCIRPDGNMMGFDGLFVRKPASGELVESFELLIQGRAHIFPPKGSIPRPMPRPDPINLDDLR